MIELNKFLSQIELDLNNQIYNYLLNFKIENNVTIPISPYSGELNKIINDIYEFIYSQKKKYFFHNKVIYSNLFKSLIKKLS